MSSTGLLVLDSRTDRLFRSRSIYENAAEALDGSPNGLIDILVALQSEIYHLDKYFESNWNLDQDRLDGLWRGIHYSLTEFLGNDGTNSELTVDIKRYQALEQGLRDKPWRIESVTGHCQLKTCDVQLVRRLIRERSKPSARANHLYWKAWHDFDLISEMCDDVDDVDEDINTYNGNRFVLGTIMYGIRFTLAEYRRSARDMTISLRENSVPRSPLGLPGDLARASLRRLGSCLDRLELQAERIDYEISKGMLARRFRCDAASKAATSQQLTMVGTFRESINPMRSAR